MDQKKLWPLKKLANKYAARDTFSQAEVREMNINAYDLGAAHALEQTAILYGLGPKRLDDAKETLDRTSYRELHEYGGKFSMFDVRKRFTKHEAAIMNREAYRLGVDHTLESVSYSYRLGGMRLTRIKEALPDLQALDIEPLERAGNVYEARLRREIRRTAAGKKVAGRVLDEA